MARRPAPPAWAVDPERVARNKDAAKDKFVKWTCKKAASFRGLPDDEALAALESDAGVPGAFMSSIVPEVPWHKAVFVNNPVKGADRIGLEAFFSNGRSGSLELLESKLWDEFAAAGDAFAMFKVSGIKGADDRLFCMFRSDDAVFGVGRCRIVMPQPSGGHMVVMQVVDFVRSVI